MIVDQPSHEVSLGPRSRAVDDARQHDNDRRAVVDGAHGDAVRQDLRPLVVVGRNGEVLAGRRQRQKGRSVNDARDPSLAACVNHVPQPRHVHIVEVLRPGAPQADECCRVTDRVDVAHGVAKAPRIANVAVQRSSRKTADSRAPREYDRLMTARRQRVHDRPA